MRPPRVIRRAWKALMKVYIAIYSNNMIASDSFVFRGNVNLVFPSLLMHKFVDKTD